MCIQNPGSGWALLPPGFALVSLTHDFLFSGNERSRSLSFSLDKPADEDDAYDFNTDYV